MAKLDAQLASGGAPTVLMIDLDGFKSINDGIGHWAGDAVLSTVARRIEGSVPVGQVVGRLGGDEFLVVLSNEEQGNNLRIASSLVGAVEESINVDHRVVQVSASVGISQTVLGDDSASLIRRADQAMYAAKAAGRGQVRVAEQPLRRQSDADLNLNPEPQLARADSYDLSSVDEAIAGMEVLVQPVGPRR